MEPLYQVEFDVTYDLFMDCQLLLLNVRTKKKDLRIVSVIVFICAILLIVTGVKVHSISDIIFGASFVVFSLGYKPFFKWVYKRSAKKAWESNKIIQNMTYHYSFYEDMLECSSDISNGKYEYSKLYKIYEGDKQYVLMIANNQGLPLKKDVCPESMVEFFDNLLEKYPNLEAGN